MALNAKRDRIVSPYLNRPFRTIGRILPPRMWWAHQSRFWAWSLSLKGIVIVHWPVTSTHNEDLHCGDWFVTGGIRLPFLPTRWSVMHTPNPSNSRRVQLTVRES